MSDTKFSIPKKSIKPVVVGISRSRCRSGKITPFANTGATYTKCSAKPEVSVADAPVRTKERLLLVYHHSASVRGGTGEFGAKAEHATPM